MLCQAEQGWRARASLLCCIARRSSPRWSRLAYGGRREGRLASTRPDVDGSDPVPSKVGQDAGKAWGTVTTSDAGRTSLDTLLAQLPSDAVHIPSPKRRVKSPLDPSVLLALLTPSYANAALDPQLPTKLLHKLSGPGHWPRSLHTITAVVDRLPGGEGATASEGIAFGWRTKRKPQFIERMLAPTAQNEMSPSAQKPGWLHFNFTHGGRKDGSTEGRPFLHHGKMGVQLPLARTIFTNGMVSTLVHRLYTPDDKTGQLQLSKETFLESFNFEASLYAGQQMPRLHAPLVPLTPARSIQNVMGNIIRTVSGEPSFSGSGKTSPETQPASEELEQAVTAFFAAADIEPQPVSVWALIIPSPLPSSSTNENESTYRLLGSQDDDLRKLWKSKESSSLVDSALNNLLPAGARLRKVLSGGGGWGKKAGLLSLDPDERYSTRELRQGHGWEVDINEDMKEQQKQALGQAAKQGESVMFFLAPDGLAGYVNDHTGSRGSEDLTIDFASLPSSIDTMPSAGAGADNDKRPVIKYHPGLLGAFSEEGLAMTLQGGDQASVVLRTKFDVPHSRITVQRQSPTHTSGGRRNFSTAATWQARKKASAT